MRFIVANKQTHFECNGDLTKAHCTHGGWGGSTKFNTDGSFEVAGVIMQSWEETVASTYDEALRLGDICDS